MILTYEARGSAFSSGGEMHVNYDGEQIARITMRPGLLIKGPSWTWHTNAGPLWSVASTMGTYAITATDGTDLGQLRKPMMQRDIELVAPAGWWAEADVSNAGSNATRVTAGGSHIATVTRQTALGSRMFSRRETWQLTLHTEVPELAQPLLSALPLVIDHQHRRRESSG